MLSAHEIREVCQAGKERDPRAPRRGTGPLVALLLLGLLAGTASAGTYYVDASSPQCSPTGPGTVSQPYCTISAALAAHGSAGNTILVQPGTYRETVTFAASGTSLAPVVLRANGPGVVIDGADDLSATGAWAAYSGDVWFAAGVTWSPLQVFADGARLTETGNSPTSLQSGTYRYVAGEGLYVNAGGGNPGLHGTLVGRRSNAFVVSGRSWITLDGFTVTHTEDRSIYVSGGSTDIAVLGCVVTFSNRYGIYVNGCQRVRIAGNVVTDSNDHGIDLTGGCTGCLIEDNESARNAVPGTRKANGLYMHDSTGNTIRRNRWHDNQDTGQDFQLGASNNLSYENVSWNNGDHGYDHLAATGNVHLNDVAYGNFKDGFSIEGTSPGTQLTNCIAVNNGLTTNEYDLWVDATSTSGFVSNDNIFWNATSQQPFKFNKTVYATLAGYQAGSGQDSRTLQADPKFASPAAGDFHLLGESPAIDNGNSSSPDWPATDAGGFARVNDPSTADAGLGPITYSDRGAYEFQPAGLPPVAVLVASPSMATAPAIVTLDATGSHDPEGGSLTYWFDFGDGTGAGPQASPSIVHTYSAGTYTAKVSVVDGSGLGASDSVTVIANQRPVASLAGAPLSGHAPLTASFDAAGSADGDGTVASYTFDFGDGTTLGPQASPAATHTYAAGHWQATVTVTDDRGAVSLPSAAVAVDVTPPNLAPVAALSLSPLAGHAPLLVTADASGSSDADGQVVSYTFDFGDGTVVGPQPGATATHVFASGPQAVTVLVTDNEGATGSAGASLTVSPPDRAPLVVAPDTATVNEGAVVTVDVTATDPDGGPLSSLTADVSALPAGNDATFTPAADQSGGELVWHPTFADSGSYRVTFVGANAMADTVSTWLRIRNVDRPPLVTAPAVFLSAAGRPLALSVGAADPDGDAITTLTADLASLPAAGTFTFTPAADEGAGVLEWTPAAKDTGTYTLTFSAANALVGSAVTRLTVTAANLPPTAVLAVTPKSGNDPLPVTASASGSTDPEGAPLTYGFDFGDGFVVGPQASANASHRYAAGTWKLLATVTDTAGAVSRDSVTITVAATGPGMNLAGNSSFEFARTGWAPFAGSRLFIDPGGFEGARCLRVAGPANLNSFGIDDSLDWVRVAGSAGARYRFSAWVRSGGSQGSARLRVREFAGASQVGETMLSPPVPLTSDWQLVAAEYVTRSTGSSLDFQVLDQPAAKSETFQVDDIAIVTLASATTERTPVAETDPPSPGPDGRGSGSALPIAAPPDSTPAAAPAAAPAGAPAGFSAAVATGARAGTATLTLALTRPGPVRIDIYDLAGRRVRRIADAEFMAPGLHSITLDDRGDAGERLGNGVYFYRVQAPERSVTGRFVIVR